MKIQDLNIKLNIKTFCLYEQMAGKSYLECNTEEDIKKLLYCAILINNPNMPYTYEVVENTLFNNKKTMSYLAEKYFNISLINKQFTNRVREKNEKGASGDTKDFPFISDIAASLIIKYHLDPRYVYYDMDLWELGEYYDVIDIMHKEELIDKRFWTWLSMTPHIDGRKVKSPEKLLPFDFEKEEKKKAAEKKLAQEQDKVLKMFDMFNKPKKEEEDGTGQSDNSI